MKKILFIIVFLFSISANADVVLNVTDAGSENENGTQDMIISSINTSTGVQTNLLTFTAIAGRAVGSSFIDDYNNKLYIGHSGGRYSVYDINTNTVTIQTIGSGGYVAQTGWDGSNTISKTTNSEGISEVHIGENSLVTYELGGRQQLFATNANNSRIDINIPSGTNLLIDGEDVMGKIDSSVALGAALASLPTGAEGAGYTCGLGTGFHDSASAISGGCGFDFANYAFVETMPTMFQKASFNVGVASVVHGEGDDATLKAGITFKFGAPKPVREARDDNLFLENKIDAVMQENRTLKAQLKEENDTIREENDLLKAQIVEINTQLKALNMLAMN